jgi:8-oxo-dGTP pyrophosphatase MutT (NUDIX family)
MKFDQYMKPKYIGAGIVFLTSCGKTLILQKENKKWSFPGGHANIGETPYKTAKRECFEETGYIPKNKAVGKLRFFWPKKKQYTYSFFVLIEKPYTPVLSSEHRDYAWKKINKIPSKKMTEIFSKHWEEYIRFANSIID